MAWAIGSSWQHPSWDDGLTENQIQEDFLTNVLAMAGCEPAALRLSSLP